MNFINLSPPDAEKVFGYAFAQITAEEWNGLKSKKVITVKEVRRCFKQILDNQSDYNLTGLSKVSLGWFSANEIYWPELKDTPLTEHIDGMAFCATARHWGALLSNESYVYILWPLRSQRVYIVPFEMVQVSPYSGRWGSISNQFLGSKEEYIEVDGHPFSASIMFLRGYWIHRKGLFKKTVVSIQFLSDFVRYLGNYDDAPEGCPVWDRTVDYPLFWLDEHKEDITPLKDLDIPDYSKRKEMGF